MINEDDKYLNKRESFYLFKYQNSYQHMIANCKNAGDI